MDTRGDMIGVLEGEGPAASAAARPRWQRPARRTWWLIGAVVVAFLTAMCLLIADQLHERDRFDQLRASLATTRDHIATVSAELATLRHDVAVLTTQVGNDTTALQQDVSQLQGAQSALTAAQAHVTAQASQISALHTCLGGVEQALNALSVGHHSRAISVLSSVSSSCSAAAASSG